MDLKSYIRGLGVGIAVTTVVLVISFRAQRQAPTNAEIVSMAKELGMVETSAFLQTESSEAPTEEPSSQISGEDMTQPSADATEGNAQTTEDVETESFAEESSEAQEITVALRGIEYAYLASDALKEAGVIDNKEEFEWYMTSNGYSRRIQDGVYTFTKDMTYEEIAKIICHIK